MSVVASLPQSQLPARGVYRVRGRVLGRSAYYAITSEGRILGGALRFVMDGESDAKVALLLFRALDRVDPVGLQLVLPAPHRVREDFMPGPISRVEVFSIHALESAEPMHDPLYVRLRAAVGD